MHREAVAPGAGLHNERLVGNQNTTMTLQQLARHSTLALALGLSITGVAVAQTSTAPSAKKAAKSAPKSSPKAAAKAPPVDLTPPASPEQVDAAQRVFYGTYECETDQKLEILADPKHENYVEVKHLKSVFTMKPVLSTTGAIRLEDVRGETLMVQIAAKSMLLNVKTGHRIVDACITAKQRELMDAAKVAAAASAPK